jgi:ABC-2 type transport system ATP-binding protein
VSFKVKKGEILGFLGPNAAGKTTTMRILTCFLPPTDGTAKVAGFDVFEDSIEVRRRVGYMPETVPVYSDMFVSSYLSFVAEAKGVDGRERKRHIASVMECCGLGEVSSRLIGRLSKGYRQRVGLAQALIGDPEVLILDEPTIGLDPKQIIEIRQMIKSLANKKTIILSSHILPEVSMVCSRVVIINEGRVVAVDTPENLTAQLQKSAKIQVQVEGPVDLVTRSLSSIKGVVSVQKKESIQGGISSYVVEASKDVDMRKEVSSAIVKNGWGLLEIRSVGMSLEDVFIRLVTREEELGS